jgi:hypothetical protein
MTQLSRDPLTQEEWQEAVDAAEFYLLLHSARQYGLVKGGPEVNLDRCDEMLKRGRERGIVPAPIEQLTERFMVQGGTS